VRETLGGDDLAFPEFASRLRTTKTHGVLTICVLRTQDPPSAQSAR
jgi:hypothetical protein